MGGALLHPGGGGFGTAISKQIHDMVRFQIFLRVVVKRQFFLLSLASEGGWCLSVLNSHGRQYRQARGSSLTLWSMFFFLQGGAKPLQKSLMLGELSLQTGNS